MKHRFTLPVMLLALICASYASGDSATDALDALHRAGAEANPATFISLLTADAVVLGLPGNTRLSGQSLRDHIGASFSSSEAWNYRGAQRQIRYSDDGAVAWFDESLEHDQQGRGWGSGVLVRSGAGWRVAQYSLNMPADIDAPPPLAAPAVVSVGNEPGTQAETAAASEMETPEPVQQHECRKLRHKTNKASRC